MDGAFQTGVSPVSVRPPNCTSTRRLAGGQLSTLDSGKSLAISQLYPFSPGKFPVAGGAERGGCLSCLSYTACQRHNGRLPETEALQAAAPRAGCPGQCCLLSCRSPQIRLAAGGLGESQTPRTQEEAHGFVTVVSWPGGPGKCRVEGYF